MDAVPCRHMMFLGPTKHTFAAHELQTRHTLGHVSIGYAQCLIRLLTPPRPESDTFAFMTRSASLDTFHKLFPRQVELYCGSRENVGTNPSMCPRMRNHFAGPAVAASPTEELTCAQTVHESGACMSTCLCNVFVDFTLSVPKLTSHSVLTVRSLVGA